MKQLQIGEHVYNVSATVTINKYSLKVEESSLQVKDYLLTDIFEDEDGVHEVFELLPTREEKITTGAHKNDPHISTWIPYNSDYIYYSYEDCYGNPDFIDYKYQIWSVNEVETKERIKDRVSELLNGITETKESLQQFIDNI